MLSQALQELSAVAEAAAVDLTIYQLLAAQAVMAAQVRLLLTG
jgi:hypothetical protein